MRERRQRPDGWRTLRLHAYDLWWHAGAPHVKTEGLTEVFSIAIAIERADGSGKKLRATWRGTRPFEFGASPIAVDPDTIRRCVARVAPKGAWPTGTGVIAIEL